MAKNLRAKIPDTDVLYICDTNSNATKKFMEEVDIAALGKGKGIHIAENPKEVAQKAVSPPHPHSPPALVMNIVLSMI